jgi:hypothetical protein
MGILQRIAEEGLAATKGALAPALDRLGQAATKAMLGPEENTARRVMAQSAIDLGQGAAKNVG